MTDKKDSITNKGPTANNQPVADKSKQVLAAFEKFINQGYPKHTAMYMAQLEVNG